MEWYWILLIVIVVLALGFIKFKLMKSWKKKNSTNNDEE